MVRDDLVALLQQRLSGATGLEQQIINELNATQNRLESERSLYPWFLIRSYNIAVDTTGQALVPNGFLKEYDEDEGGMITADGVKLRKTNRADFGSSDSCSDLPAPSLYDIVGDVIYFYPIPANGPTVTLWYYGRDLPLTANIENGWLREAPHLMACETGFMIELFIADPNGLKVYAGLVPEARKNFSDRVIERRQANLRTYYGKRQ